MPLTALGESTMEELIGITPAEHLAHLILGPKSDEGKVDEPFVKVSLRLPVSTIAYLDSFAFSAERSRNFIAQNCIVVGIHAVMEALPETERNACAVDVLTRQAALVEGEAE